MGSQNGCPSICVPRGNSTCFCLSGRLFKIKKWTDPVSFRATASVLGLIVYEICAHSLRVGSLFPIVFPLTLLHISVTGLQEAYLLIESPHNPQAGELSVRFRILAPWGEVWIMIILLFVVTYPVIRTWLYHVPALLPKSLSFILYICSCEKHCLLVSRYFLYTIAL